MSKKRLHIAFFTNTYHPTVSGVVRSIDLLKTEFNKMGHNVFIFAQRHSKYQDNEPFVFRYPSVRIPTTQGEYDLPVPTSTFIHKLIPKLKLDIIHTHHPFILGVTGAKKAAELNIPLITTLHTRYELYTHYVPIYQPLVKEVLDYRIKDYIKKCQQIIVPTQSIYNRMTREGVDNNLSIIPTGIDLFQFKQAKKLDLHQKYGWNRNDLVIITVNRLAQEKNIRLLINSMAKLVPQFPSLRLVVVGDGDLRKTLEKQIKKLGLKRNIIFEGSVPYQQIPSYLKAADIFAFTSVTETQGIVTIEAMASELPIVAVNATGTRDVIIDQKNGLLTQNTINDFSTKLQQLIEDDSLRQRMSRFSRIAVKQYDIKDQAAKMIEVYQRAINLN